MTDFATFRSDPVSCAGAISQPIINRTLSGISVVGSHSSCHRASQSKNPAEAGFLVKSRSWPLSRVLFIESVVGGHSSCHRASQSKNPAEAGFLVKSRS